MNDLLGLTPEDAVLICEALEVSSYHDIERWPAAKQLRWHELSVKLEAHAKLVPPPLGKDKVWHGLTMRLVDTGTVQNQAQTIVRARSAAEAVRLLNAAGEYISASHFKNYWGLTGNREQLVQAVEPGGLG